MPRKIWVPYLQDAFDKEEKTESEHSKWLHSSETVYLKIFLIFFLILLFINASFIVMYFLTYYFLYNGHYLVIIWIW